MSRRRKVIELVIPADEFDKVMSECEGLTYDYEEMLDFIFEHVVKPLLEELGYEVTKYEKFVHASTLPQNAWASPDFDEFVKENPYLEDEELAYAEYKKAKMLISFAFPAEEWVSALVWFKRKRVK